MAGFKFTAPKEPLAVNCLCHPALAPYPEHLIDTKEMYYAPLPLPLVVMKNHVRPLGGKDPDIFRTIFATVAVDVMHHLFGK